MAAIKLESESDRVANERGRIALEALIQIARGDDTAAAKALDSMKTRLDKSPIDQPEWMHWPEMVLAAHALERPRLRLSAQSILETMAGAFDRSPAIRPILERPPYSGNNAWITSAAAPRCWPGRRKAGRKRRWRLGPIQSILLGRTSRRRGPRAVDSASRSRTGVKPMVSSPITPAMFATSCI